MEVNVNFELENPIVFLHADNEKEALICDRLLKALTDGFDIHLIPGTQSVLTGKTIVNGAGSVSK